MLTLPSRLVIQFLRYASISVSHMVSNILPVPYHICYYEAASDLMDHYPESLEAECYPCFSYGQDGNPRTIFISVAHDMTCGPGPDSLNASYHGRFIHIANPKPANHKTAITVYLIFLRRGILAISGIVLLQWNLS